MLTHAKPAPVGAKFWTPGVIVLLALMGIGFFFIIARYIGGLAAVTNLNNSYPWGLWIGVDVETGVAMAAGGFTTAALVHIFGRHKYKAITRSALLAAMLGYTAVALSLAVDVGRTWAMWFPIVLYRNPNSVLFEVATCVTIYLNVLYIEFIPIVMERLKGKISLPGRFAVYDETIEKLLDFLDRILGRVMWVFIIAGVVLSCMHQSSLGSLMLVAPTKCHPLWYTPILPLLFLTSAITVGFPIAFFVYTIATTSLRLDSEMDVFTPLTRITAFLLGAYMVLKIGDMVVRGSYIHLLENTVQSTSFLVEMVVGVIIPWCMLLSQKVRRSKRALFISCTLIVGGVALNRMNVFLVAYRPQYTETSYFPSIGEMAVTAAFIAGVIFFYRVCVTYFPVLGSRR